MRVETHPEADAEIAEAVAYYDDKSEAFEVGLRFLGNLAVIGERLRGRPVSNLPPPCLEPAALSGYASPLRCRSVVPVRRDVARAT